MHKGMLWFDNSSAALNVKIRKATEYYQKKYGRKPDLCLVNPQLFSSGNGSPGAEPGITVRPSKFVLPDHLWLGIEEKP